MNKNQKIIESLLEIMATEGAVVRCGIYKDYLLRSVIEGLFTHKLYMVYNTEFRSQDVKKITISKKSIPVITLKSVKIATGAIL